MAAVPADPARTTRERQILDAPLDEDDDATLELDEVREVDEGPHDPGEQARQVHAEHVATAAHRPITARLPLSKYSNGASGGFPRSLRTTS